MELTFAEFGYLGLCLEGFFFGLYSGIFAIYLHARGSQQSTDKTKTIIFYALWALYALSAATISADIMTNSWPDLLANIQILYPLQIIQGTGFACCDFIAQLILIYRCWIVWGYNIRVVIVPSFLAFAFLAIYIASGTSPLFVVQDQLLSTDWNYTLTLTGLTLSMTVNALMTGLIVFRISKVFREVKTSLSTADNQILGVTGGSTLQRVIFILIESGMALFSIQVVRLVVSAVSTDAANDAYYLISGTHLILSGITPTFIFVRVSMGLSFHDESSLGSLRFEPDNRNTILETASIDILDEERRSNNIDIQLNDN